MPRRQVLPRNHIPIIDNLVNLFPIADIALKAIGRVAFPLTPPYVVRFSRPTAGHAVVSAFKLIKPDTVLIAETPSAPPVRY